MSPRELQLDDRGDEYACPDDFQHVFTERITSLYKLSFLLTGNRVDAERCFVAAFDDMIELTSVPKHSVRSRAKRSIVEKAVYALKPRLEEKPDGSLLWRDIPARDYVETFTGPKTVIRRVLSLRTFERFVFVLCLLERYSVEECAVFLGCDVRDVVEGRTRALIRIASSGARVPH